ncbi:MAG: sulfurtransferase [Candidatus Muproteobacteria bacterium RBG_16_64_11]|uniref:Sulfurtransferase n=1 Tax=Candidatus Muproteobacteria bacterium RBG_16_64_11 TaxID=1817758 RepID=A0A1F6TGX8_9PROT|nr:MAG: sulfurtransferase [Candidatus Muproteobacteria bacterium RBG_16_64_11]
MVRQITPRDLKAWLETPGEKPLILDVREAWERRLCALPEAVHIPMNQIPDRLAELEAERDVVILCHHGMRSQQVALYLERLGFGRLHNLRGGIDAWAKEVDAGMAKY